MKGDVKLYKRNLQELKWNNYFPSNFLITLRGSWIAHLSPNSQILLIGVMKSKDLGNVQSGVPG